MTSVSVVVPAYNEETTIIGVLERVRKQAVEDVDFEVVVVNDGSTDGTRRLLDDRSDLYDRVIHLEQNRGKGAAVKAALGVATGDFVLFQDADLEYDPADYVKLLLPVTEFGADVVMGSRMVGPEYTRVHYFWNKVGNRAITLLFDSLYNSTLSDIYSGYLLYRRSLLDPGELRTEGWEQQAEILCHVVPRAGAVYEVPINYRGRTIEEGKKIRAHHVIPIFWTIIRLRLRPPRRDRAPGTAGNTPA